MTKLLNLSLTLAALVAAPALAEPPVPNRVVVSAADLDLASSAGQRALDRRLAQGVIEACGTASAVDLAGTNEVRRCRVETSAVIAADRERLIALASRAVPIVVAAR